MNTVTFESGRFDGVLALHFHLYREPGGSVNPVNVGFELRETPLRGAPPWAATMTETTFVVDEGPMPVRRPRQRWQVDAEQLERIVLDYSRYLQIARTALLAQEPWPSDDDRQAVVKRARRRGRGRRGLDREFFEILAAEVKEREALGDKTIATTLASKHNVDRSTASRWLKRLREGGYLHEEADD